jgi:hypothetical protein
MKKLHGTEKLHVEEGQATAEYALVIVAAAAVAGALIVWATRTGALAALFDAVVEHISRLV